jgi:hypothetical protein
MPEWPPRSIIHTPADPEATHPICDQGKSLIPGRRKPRRIGVLRRHPRHRRLPSGSKDFGATEERSNRRACRNRSPGVTRDRLDRCPGYENTSGETSPITNHGGASAEKLWGVNASASVPPRSEAEASSSWLLRRLSRSFAGTQLSARCRERGAWPRDARAASRAGLPPRSPPAGEPRHAAGSAYTGSRQRAGRFSQEGVGWPVAEFRDCIP